MSLQRADECADDTSSSYNLTILINVLGGLIDLLRAAPRLFPLQRRRTLARMQKRG